MYMLCQAPRSMLFLLNLKVVRIPLRLHRSYALCIPTRGKAFNHREHRGHREEKKKDKSFSLCSLCPLWLKSFLDDFLM